LDCHPSSTEQKNCYSIRLCCGRFQSRGTGDGDDADIVFLAERLGGVGYLNGETVRTQQLMNALEAEQ